jgi:DHA1 family multidrug resistance protein-like MFS transporter
VRGWTATQGALTFLSIGLGILLCCVYIGIDTRVRFNPLLARSDKFVNPEARLPPMIVGSILLPIGLFWFAWTSSPSICAISQVAAGICIGMGIFLVFLPAQVYVIDCYLMNANSALAATSFARALMASGFPLFAIYMYTDLGVDWATSLLGFLCVGMIPFPLLFWVYGEKLRAKGKFSVVL